jgi:Zn-dependent protease
VTLNPLAHADPIGTIALPLMGLLMGGGTIGWGRPVQINPVKFTRSLTLATGRMFVAAAGPTMNILLAMLISGVYALLVALRVELSPAATMAIWSAVQLNFFLAAFNLVPVEPLDGGAVLRGLLPRAWSDRLRFTEQYGWLILTIVMFSPLRAIYQVPATWAFRSWMGVVLGSPLLGS